MHIYYLLEKQMAVQPAIIYGKTNSSATSFNMKNCSTEQNHAIKRGLGQKNCAVKKCSKFATKNVPCVDGTIEIKLE